MTQSFFQTLTEVWTLYSGGHEGTLLAAKIPMGSSRRRKERLWMVTGTMNK